MTSRKGKTQKKKPEEKKKATEETGSPQEPQEPRKEAAASTEEPIATEPQLPQVPKNPFESLTYPFKVIVSPLKAFQRISAYPDFKGFIVIIVLLMLASAALQFSGASKLFLNINDQRTSLVSTIYLTDLLVSGIIESVILFALDWLVFAGALLLIATIIGAKGGGWRPFFVMVGYAFIVLVVRTVATAVLYSALPPIYLSFSVWPPATESDQADYINQVNTVWGPLLAAQVSQFLSWAIDAWLAILAAIGVRVHYGVTWTRAATISVTAYLIYLTVRIFLQLGL